MTMEQPNLKLFDEEAPPVSQTWFPCHAAGAAGEMHEV
jgi:hypothetical protein